MLNDSSSPLRRLLNHRRRSQRQRRRRRLVIGGHNVQEHRYPYYVSIDKNNGVIVSGALIAPDIVLTAGHVVLDHMDNLTIKVGPYAPSMPTTQTNNNDNESFVENIPMEQYVLHPEWSTNEAGLFVNDYLILKLLGPSSHRPIVMNRNPRLPTGGMHVVLMGVGWTLPVIVSPSVIVQQVELVCIDNDICNNISDPIRGLSYVGQVDGTMLCTVSPPNTTRDGCAWDSGDPVIIPGRTANDDILVGLGSSGVECADPIFPATQARISAGLQWIDSIVCQLSVDPPHDFGCNNKTTTNDEQQQPNGVLPDDPLLLVSAADLTTVLSTTAKARRWSHGPTATIGVCLLVFGLLVVVVVLVGTVRKRIRHVLRQPVESIEDETDQLHGRLHHQKYDSI